jgi:uncharacterized repeat protein (TIGR01451 family)
VRKAVTPTTVVAGEVVTFTIELSNTLTSSFEVSRITDTLPSGFTFGGRLDSEDTLPAETTGPSPGDTGTITWTFASATVPADTSHTLIYTTTATSVVGTYANQATAQTTADTLNPNTASAVLDVGAPALSLAKSVSPSAANPGDLLTYTLTYGNDSSLTVHDVVISDTLPDGTTFEGASAICGPSSGVVSCAVGTLADGETGHTVTITARIDDPYLGANPLTNVALIDSDETPPGSSNEAYTFVSGPNLILDKAVTPMVAEPGDRVTYTISYGNNGDLPAEGVFITDAVPSNFEIVSPKFRKNERN